MDSKVYWWKYVVILIKRPDKNIKSVSDGKYWLKFSNLLLKYQVGLIGISCGALWPNSHVEKRKRNACSSQNLSLAIETVFSPALLQK